MLVTVTKLPLTWDIDCFYPGGSESPQLAGHLESLEQQIAGLKEKAAHAPLTAGPDTLHHWADLVDNLQAIWQGLGHDWSFVGCLNAQNTKDRPAKLLQGRMAQLAADAQAVLTLIEDKMLKMPDEVWQQVLAGERLQPVAFPLQERRQLAKQKMAPALETLGSDLAVNGYHAWGNLYETIVGRITIPVEVDGKEEKLSVGQANNKFYEPDRAFRKELFTKWEEAWANEAELIAASLNNLGGFRLSLYKHRQWDSVLKEPMDVNRMTEATLWAMWEAVGASKAKLAEYYRRKAKLLGYEAINWYDLTAPLYSTTKKVSYDEAAAFIIEHFGKFSPGLAAFSDRAFKERWIEVEDRAHKAPGGFCTGFPANGESRIFMTYSGDVGGVRTLAHELGHAYHSYVMKDQPILTQDYAMNVAETASTFAEILISAAAIEEAESKEEKLALLDSKIADSAAYLMNIHSRFIFEREFYEARRKGPVSIERLNEMMVSAQKQGYSDALGEYHPYFWAAKGHFYGTGMPFYNFPYTFGYLFSAGIYARAVEEGPTFEQKYIDLLRDTGRMTVEELASRQIGRASCRERV